MVSFFKDFTKPVTSILKDDFDCKNKVTASVAGPCCTKVKIEDDIGTPLSKKGGKLTVKYAHSSGFSLDKLALDGKGVKLETSLSKLTPGLKLLYKGAPACTTVGAEFTNKLVAADFSIDSEFKKADLSLCVSKNQASVGSSVKLNGTDVADYKVGLSYTQGGIFSGLTFDKTKTIGLDLSWKSCPVASVAASCEKKGDVYSVSVGTSYNCNPKTTIKAVTDNKLDMKLACIQTLDKKTTVAGSATFNAKAVKDIKYGIAVTMG